jgi:hypothetical protein
MSVLQEFAFGSNGFHLPLAGMIRSRRHRVRQRPAVNVPDAASTGLLSATWKETEKAGYDPVHLGNVGYMRMGLLTDPFN